MIRKGDEYYINCIIFSFDVTESIIEQKTNICSLK